MFDQNKSRFTPPPATPWNCVNLVWESFLAALFCLLERVSQDAPLFPDQPLTPTHKVCTKPLIIQLFLANHFIFENIYGDNIFEMESCCNCVFKDSYNQTINLGNKKNVLSQTYGYICSLYVLPEETHFLFLCLKIVAIIFTARGG